MIELIAFRDDGWYDTTTDFRMWDHLARAYRAHLRLVREWSEIETERRLVVVDEGGIERLDEHVVDPTAAYVFGRTGLDLLFAPVPHDTSVRIDTPEPVSLFGSQAAAIVLARLAWQ